MPIFSSFVKFLYCHIKISVKYYQGYIGISVSLWDYITLFKVLLILNRLFLKV